MSRSYGLLRRPMAIEILFLAHLNSVTVNGETSVRVGGVKSERRMLCACSEKSSNYINTEALAYNSQGVNDDAEFQYARHREREYHEHEEYRSGRLSSDIEDSHLSTRHVK